MASIKNHVDLLSHATYQKEPQALGTWQLHDALSRAVMLSVNKAWDKSRRQHDHRRRAYYLSAEFLVGRAIYNNLLCTGKLSEARRALEELGTSLDRMEEIEDAALGNGGLGRLAACFLDSAATLGLPLDGYGIRYRFGLFRQQFVGGFQQEAADDWARFGDPWSVRVDEDAVTVDLGDMSVRAVPYDMPIIGYGGKHVSTLRLWQAEAHTPFDFTAFNDQNYDKAVREKNRAEDITRVLYPNDSTKAGKLLRLKQQYFFCSASLQDALRKYESVYGDNWDELPRRVTFQLNDTHPVISIPELIRLLMQRQVEFSAALRIAKQVFNYTNHTIMQEALEKWDVALVRQVAPECARLIRRMARVQETELRKADVDEDTWDELLLLQGSTVHMAYLACWCSTHINGVAQLHTDILKRRVLRHWHELYPTKIQNKTNGITQRRWLALCNRPLAGMITDLLGDEDWIRDLDRLRELERYAQDETVLRQFMAVKKENKRRLSDYILRHDGVKINPDAMLDVQVKRLHEYKRQLLNILCILELYFELREGSLTDFTPTTFLFGAKAAPGYFRAKAIIKLIHEVAALIAEDDKVSSLMQVVFVSDYNVSYAEKIMAAADVSEQISTAGTEASGTGNMKLMLNGAVTLGTYDGANVEIVAQAGEENNYIFGARVEDIDAVRDTYNARALYEEDAHIKRCLDALIDGTLDDGGTGMFRELYTALLDGADWHKPDHYYLLLDFEDCLRAKREVNRDYGHDRLAFAAKQWHNMCAAGKFSSDRTIAEYARDIWHIR